MPTRRFSRKTQVGAKPRTESPKANVHAPSRTVLGWHHRASWRADAQIQLTPKLAPPVAVGAGAKGPRHSNIFSCMDNFGRNRFCTNCLSQPKRAGIRNRHLPKQVASYYFRYALSVRWAGRRCRHVERTFMHTGMHFSF